MDKVKIKADKVQAYNYIKYEIYNSDEQRRAQS